MAGHKITQPFVYALHLNQLGDIYTKPIFPPLFCMTKGQNHCYYLNTCTKVCSACLKLRISAGRIHCTGRLVCMGMTRTQRHTAAGDMLQEARKKEKKMA